MFTQAPLQSEKSAGQVGKQTPCEHEPGGQSWPHPPQLVGLVARSTHCPPQTAGFCPPAHRHRPLKQAAPFTQEFAQNPQLLGSETIEVQTPKQLVWPGPQVTDVHTPALHVWPAPQVIPHAPQSRAFVARSTHWPPQDAGRCPRHPHLPETHWSPFGHTSPHVPQLRGSAFKLTQAPPQLVVPAAQTGPHWPCAQTSPGGQMTPHCPQSDGLDLTSTQLPLQSVVP
jgi:hypothetical protein